MENDMEKVEAIEACRTCGIFYMTTSNYLKPLFQSPVEQPEMMLIRLELAQWKVEVGENDGYPQYLCSTCIHEFQKIFKFRTSCVDTQDQFRHFYSMREENRANIKIKTELPDPIEDQPVCDFIYVDELSDNEYDGTTPFNIPHVPIKEELIEAATIPMEDSVQSTNIMESAARVVQIALQPPVPQNEIISNIIAPSVAVVRKLPEQVECKLCPHISSSPEEHTQHMHRAHEVSDMTCHICGKKFNNSTPARLKFHMKWHNLNKYVKCAQCGFVCNSKEALQEHKRANHSKINCKICGKGVSAKKMKSHLREHALLSKYPCEYCTEAFPSENERESHIWQIHANDDDDDNNQIASTSDLGNEEERSQNILDMPTEEEEEELLRDDEPDDLVNFKFFCAHCDGKFIQQIDLERHVIEEHRSKPEFTATTELEPIATNNDVTINTIDNVINDDHTAIAVFEDYDNESHSTQLHKPENESFDQSLIGMTSEHHTADLIHSDMFTNPSARDETDNDETVHNDQEITNEHLEVQKESQIETTYSSTQEASAESYATSETTESEEGDKSDTYFAKYANDELHPFACAKCTKTFATIEQLRLHHEEHLATVAQMPSTQQLESPNKAKFKCHLCGKAFDLKFSLNRHVKKHKHAPF